MVYLLALAVGVFCVVVMIIKFKKRRINYV